MAAIPRRSVSFTRPLLAGVAALALLAPTGDGLAQAGVGVAAAVNTDARGRPPGGAPRVIALGQNVVFNEEIVTDGRGLVQVLLLDGTTFTVGPNSQLKIDEFVYDPNTGDARVVATVAKGAFRFIGGRTSRTEGGATIRTPVGTIGIRGAMVEGNVQSNSSALFSMIFGDSVTFTGNGGAQSRLFQPGFTLTVEGTGAGQDTNVRPRTGADASTFQTALAGQPGQNGGASEPPADATVAGSPVTTVNSAVILPSIAPVPSASPVQATNVGEVEDNVAELDIVTQQDVVEDVIEGGGGTVNPPVPTARVLVAPDVYVRPRTGDQFTEAGQLGLVGSNPDADVLVAFQRQNGRQVSSTGYDLPDLTGAEGDNGLTAIQVTDGIGPNGPLSGIAYAGVGNFAAYFLGENGDPTRPVYSIFGTGTDIAALLAIETGDSIRTYSLTQDPIRPSDLPFFANDLYGDPANFSTTNFLVLEPADSSNEFVKPFFSFLDISGTGAEQKSAALVFADIISRNSNGAAQIESNRRGSFRPDGDDPAFSMRGVISTTAGADDSHFFGSNAEHFVFGTQLNPAETFDDETYAGDFSGDPLDGYLGNGVFATHHVAALESETPQAALSRTPRVVAGFLTGIGESATNPNGYRLSSTGSPNLLLEIPDRNLISVEATASDANDEDSVVDNILVRYGPSATGDGGSTFIDDNRFGAIQSSGSGNTRLRTDLGQDAPHTSDISAGGYFVSGRAAPVANFQHCATCTFIDWGWWGTDIRIDANGTEELSSDRREFVHLGTWVAGDITNRTDLPTNISATFEGTALGNVSRELPSGVTARYIATGDVDLTYDFNARTGLLSIDNFDGLSVDGVVSDASSDVDALFGGFLTGTNDLQGSVAGAFVNDGSDLFAGIIADFGISGSGLTVIGTLAGERISTGPAAATVDLRVLTSPDTFTPIGDTTAYGSVGSRGLVGSTPETDRNLEFSRQAGRLVSVGGEISLPDLISAGAGGFATINVSDGVFNGQEVTGPAYVGSNGFAAYLLGIEGDAARPFFAITGTPTPDAVLQSLFAGTQIREYSLTQDPIRPSPIPFFAEDLYGDPVNSNVSSLFLIESDTAAFHVGEPNFDTKALQTSLTIDGEGVNQKSAILAALFDVADFGNGDIEAGGVRRGSFRYASTAGPANMRSGISLLEGTEGNQGFGDDLNNFVLGADLDPVDGFSDSLLGPGFSGNPNEGYLGTAYPFSTHHVANLEGVSEQAALTRTQRTRIGYMTGIGESSADGVNNPYVLASGASTTFALNVFPQGNLVGAIGLLVDPFDQSPVVESYLIGFGVIDSTGGSSAFVDDDRFAAGHNGDNENTRLRTDGGQDIANLTGDNPGSYLISGRANPLPGYQHCTACTFLDWGWWGTRVRVGPNGAEIPDQRSDYVHLGTWVAGDIARPADLPTHGSATFNGTALGNVVRETPGAAPAKYIASGDFDMSFDFSTRTGNAQISNFDGLNLISEVSDRSNTEQALFGGTLAGNGLVGGLDGAFVNNGPNVAAGVIGNFGATGAGLSVVGTVAGAKID